MKQTQSFHSWLLSNFALLLLSLWAVPALTTAQNITPQRGDKITTEDGVFVVSGDNMITNPSFDDGFTDWTAGDGSALVVETRLGAYSWQNLRVLRLGQPSFVGYGQ